MSKKEYSHKQKKNYYEKRINDDSLTKRQRGFAKMRFEQLNGTWKKDKKKRKKTKIRSIKSQYKQKRKIETSRLNGNIVTTDFETGEILSRETAKYKTIPGNRYKDLPWLESRLTELKNYKKGLKNGTVKYVPNKGQQLRYTEKTMIPEIENRIKEIKDDRNKTFYEDRFNNMNEPNSSFL